METENRIEEGLLCFSSLVLEEPALRSEFEASVAEFFGGPPPGGELPATLAAARRHIEWFLFERHSTTLFKVPVEALREAWRRTVTSAVRDLERAFLDSFTGVFRVTSLGSGGEAWLSDMAGFGEHPVEGLAAAGTLHEGDLVAGRLFPIPGKACHLSRAAGIFRGAELVAAVARDLESARRAAGGSRVLHVSQRELESMFWQAGRTRLSITGADPADPVAAARRFLADEGGLKTPEIEELLEALAREPFDSTKLAHGVGDALGEILDAVAFETAVDLTRARQVLTLAWAALARGGAVPAAEVGNADEAPVDQTDTGVRGPEADLGVRSALEAFEAGRRAGQELDTLFDALERDLGLADEGDDDEEATPAPDFPGVISAMVEEFLWEVQDVRGEPELAKRYEVLRSLGRFGERIGVFEALCADDLLRFTAFWLAERGELRDANAARDLLEALDAFCAWAESAHELRLKKEFGGTLERLRASLPRIVEANTKLDVDPSDDVGDLYEIVAAGGDDGCRLRDRKGHEHTARPPGAIVGLLRPGDRLRGRIAGDGKAIVYRLYPPEAADLLRA